MSFAEFFSKLESGHLMWIFGFALPGVIIAVTAIGGGYWCSIRRRQMEIQFKQSLVDKGLPADEIERVLAAPMGPQEE